MLMTNYIKNVTLQVFYKTQCFISFVFQDCLFLTFTIFTAGAYNSKQWLQILESYQLSLGPWLTGHLAQVS